MIRMHRISDYILMSLVAILFMSCSEKEDSLLKEKEQRLLRQYLDSRNIDKNPESSGIYYISIREGTGVRPEKNDWVIIKYTARLVNDMIFDTTDEDVAKRNGLYSSSVIYGSKRIDMSLLGLQGVMEGLMLMKENEKATLIIPSHLAYGSGGTGMVPPYSTIIYEIELFKVIKDPEEYEQQMIEEYLGLYADSTHLSVTESNGIYIIELDQGSGEIYPGEDDVAKVYYRGSFTDGRVFDSNTGGNTLNVTIGRQSVIPGFEEGIKSMKEEDRARILIPSTLGYGPAGSGNNIPGYTPLVFELELVEIQVTEKD